MNASQTLFARSTIVVMALLIHVFKFVSDAENDETNVEKVLYQLKVVGIRDAGSTVYVLTHDNSLLEIMCTKQPICWSFSVCSVRAIAYVNSISLIGTFYTLVLLGNMLRGKGFYHFQCAAIHYFLTGWRHKTRAKRKC